MSRSYRRPYGTYFSIKSSARKDKQIAARAMRRKQNRWVRRWDGDDLIPHRYECAHNDVWDWNRDGGQRRMVPTGWDWSRYVQAVEGWGLWAGDERWMEWPPFWYQEIVRK
jgi:hypothetical protein